MEKLLKFAITCVVLFASMGIYAEDIAGSRLERAREMLEKADSNKDGYMDRAETKAHFPILHRNFERVDSNNDEKLSIDEVKEFVAGRIVGAERAVQRVRLLHRN